MYNFNKECCLFYMNYISLLFYYMITRITMNTVYIKLFFSYFKDLQKERVQINNDKVVNIMLNNKTSISHIVIFFIIFFLIQE